MASAFTHPTKTGSGWTNRRAPFRSHHEGRLSAAWRSSSTAIRSFAPDKAHSQPAVRWRLAPGIGTRRPREEFDALGVPSKRRDARTDGAVRLMAASRVRLAAMSQHGPYTRRPGHAHITCSTRSNSTAEGVFHDPSRRLGATLPLGSSAERTTRHPERAAHVSANDRPRSSAGSPQQLVVSQAPGPARRCRSSPVASGPHCGCHAGLASGRQLRSFTEVGAEQSYDT